MEESRHSEKTLFGSLHNDEIPLRVEIDERTGRTYHAICDLPADIVLLDVSTPYSYTIWKQFRNEVCAECWRYEGGRRGFLTRRDDEGVGSRSSEREPTIGGGLWFCGQACQTGWIAREGLATMELLRALEEARRKKEKGKTRDVGAGWKPEAVMMTKKFIERQWDAIRQKEQSHKEMRKWRNLRLDNFETDMARYVLLALIHLCRERLAEKSKMATLQAQHCTQAELSKGGEPRLELGGATWSTFASLQPNELQHLRAYPELLENQLRVYQALKGRFTRSSASDQGSTETLDETGMVKEGNGGGRQEDGGARMRNGGTDRLRGLESVVTIENVRTALSVDPGNSFGIWEVPLTDESECLGFAVYPRPSFFNHHCCPNVRKERTGRAIRFVTARAVKAGEELCISYGHVENMDCQDRQKELQEGWFFECRCSRCTSEMG